MENKTRKEREILSEQELKKFRKRAIARAKNIGFDRDAEDFAQDILLRFTEGKSGHQSIDQAVLDCVRNRYGRPGKPGHRRRLALETAGSLDAENCETAAWADPRSREETRGDFERIVGMLKDYRERTAIILRYKWGLEEHEIGEALGVSESRVSQILAEIYGKLSQCLRREDERVTNPEITLESRTCACGCGSTFRCMAGSPQRYISKMHEADGTGQHISEVTRMKAGAYRSMRPELPTGLVGTAAVAEALEVSTLTVHTYADRGLIPFERVSPRLFGYDLGAVLAAAQKRGLGKYRTSSVSSGGERRVNAEAGPGTAASEEDEATRQPEALEENHTEEQTKQDASDEEGNDMGESRQKVSMSEAATTLGITYARVYEWVKIGKLEKHQDENGRTVVDLAAAREVLAGGSRRRTAVPIPKPRKSGPKKKTEEPSETDIEAMALRIAEKRFVRVLREEAEKAEANGDARSALRLLKLCLAKPRLQVCA